MLKEGGATPQSPDRESTLTETTYSEENSESLQFSPAKHDDRIDGGGGGASLVGEDDEDDGSVSVRLDGYEEESELVEIRPGRTLFCRTVTLLPPPPPPPPPPIAEPTPPLEEEEADDGDDDGGEKEEPSGFRKVVNDWRNVWRALNNFGGDAAASGDGGDEGKPAVAAAAAADSGLLWDPILGQLPSPDSLRDAETNGLLGPAETTGGGEEEEESDDSDDEEEEPSVPDDPPVAADIVFVHGSCDSSSRFDPLLRSARDRIRSEGPSATDGATTGRRAAEPEGEGGGAAAASASSSSSPAAPTTTEGGSGRKEADDRWAVPELVDEDLDGDDDDDDEAVSAPGGPVVATARSTYVDRSETDRRAKVLDVDFGGALRCHLYDALGCGRSSRPATDWDAFSERELARDLEEALRRVVASQTTDGGGAMGGGDGRPESNQAAGEEDRSRLEPNDDHCHKAETEGGSHRPIFVLGHAYGTTQVLNLVNDLPPSLLRHVRGLILVEGALSDGPVEQINDGMCQAGKCLWRLPDFLLDWLRPKVAAAGGGGGGGGDGFWEAAFHPATAHDLGRADDVGMAKAFYRQNKWASSEDAAKMKVKTLLIHGEHDHVIPKEGGMHLNDCLPNSTLSIVPESGHRTFEERPDAVCDLLLEFVADVLDLGRSGDDDEENPPTTAKAPPPSVPLRTKERP